MKKLFLMAVSLLLLVPNVSAQNTIDALKTWLATSPRKQVDNQAFANKSLSQTEAKTAETLIYKQLVKDMQAEWGKDWSRRRMTEGQYEMPFVYRISGVKPEDGRALYISMHGGGGTTSEVNQQQWNNQIYLYNPPEGVYLVPRSAVNAWNMWCQPHVDSIFNKLIQMAIYELDVNPNKVYALGYSAGGDGMYRLAPRMADRWAATSMMAGHPGDVVPVNLLNTPFMIWMGGKDAAYNRNTEAARFGAVMDSLQATEPTGYIHETHILPDKGHWMDRQDTLAIPWMAQYVRNPYPKKVIWRQDDTPHDMLYWLSTPIDEAKQGRTAIVERNGNTFTILRSDYPVLTLGMNDEMIDFRRPVEVVYKGKVIYIGKVKRTIDAIYHSLEKRRDPGMVFSAYVTLQNL